MYGENIHSRKEFLWGDLHQIAAQAHGSPCLVAGDINTARCTNENLGGRLLRLNKLSSFNDCIYLCNLIDMRSLGCMWSWNNSSSDGRRIVGRLNRCHCNGDWLDLMPESNYEYLYQSTSDHSVKICANK